jgi:type I restriction enzyme, R subunit
VLLTIRNVLDRELPRGYTPRLYEQKCDQLYQHIYDAYADAEHSLYSSAS